MTALSEAPTRLVARRRDGIAVLLGVASLLLAILAVVGPARERTQDYTWPPSSLPAASPTKAWYAPLFLSSRKPEAVTVRLPCALPPALPGVTSRPSGAIVVATSRHPESHTRLALWRLEHSLVLTIEERPMTRIPWPPAGAGEPGCSRAMRVTPGSTWQVSGPDGRVLDSGKAPPFVVTGLLSELDLREAPRPEVTVTAEVLGTSPSSRQILLSALAVALAGSALAVALMAPRAKHWPRLNRASRSRIRRSLRLVDGVVLSTLAVWWILGPSFTDDGWVQIRERNYDVSGTFATYFDNTGVNQPFGYWYEWLHHWLVLATTSVPLLRLPALGLGVTAWLLCRWVLARMLPSRLSHRAPVQWTLGTAFLIGFLSWGMTLRPEPVVAVLVGGSLAASVSFYRQPGLAPLAAAGACAVLGLAAHPEGLLTLAPLVAAAPRVVSWVRLERQTVLRPLGAVSAALCALALLVVFVDTDVLHRIQDSNLIRSRSPVAALDWRDELLRYARLTQLEFGTTLRRASVALIFISLIGFAFRRRRAEVTDLAARSLALGLVGLVLTPSKWPFHFGSLCIVASVAVAVEAARFTKASPERERSWSARPAIAILVASVAAAWAWSYQSHWGVLDLRTLVWTSDLGELAEPLRRADLGSVATWVVVFLDIFAIAAILHLVRRGRRELATVTWGIAAWAVPIIAVPLLVGTVGTFARDALVTDGWTLARQSASSLTGAAGCGLADEIVVPLPSTFIPLAPITSRSSPPDRPPRSTPPGPPPVQRLAYAPPLLDGGVLRRVSTRWFSVPDARRVGLFVAGTLDSGRILRVEWGRQIGKRVRLIRTRRLPAEKDVIRPLRRYRWRFLSQANLLPAPRGADALRFVATNSNRKPDWGLMISDPVSYRSTILSTQLQRPGFHSLINPRFGIHLPCAAQPSLANGIVEEPDALILSSTMGIWPLLDYTSPFTAIEDAQAMLELSTADSPLPIADFRVYAVDRSPRPGEALARAVAQP